MGPGRRAEQEAETRRRITEAAVKLHGSVGPAKTTVSGVAREAGVQRATVYRHFPDEDAIYEACTSHYNALHPPPDLERWASVDDPSERLRKQARSALIRGRPERGRRRELSAAAIGHALAFPTWRSLVREQGLNEDEAVELMAALVSSAASR